MITRLRIGSRPSALALAQTAQVSRDLRSLVGGLEIELVPISTRGDRLTTASLARVGGKGLFVRELEQALSAGRIDVAVHSMKDMPAVLSAEYRFAAIPVRENPHDALLTRTGEGWSSLVQNARIGTSSARRHFEALRLRPDLEVVPLRGNVDTRLKRLSEGDFDGIILAVAGLKRLGRASSLAIAELAEDEFIPCGGQGALALEIRAGEFPSGSSELDAALARLDHAATRAEVTAERAFLATIGASCASPVGVKGTLENHRFSLRARLYSADGQRTLSDRSEATLTTDTPLAIVAQAATLGIELGNRMIAMGARELIDG